MNELGKQLAPTELAQVKLEISRLQTRLARLEQMVESLSKSRLGPEPINLDENSWKV